MLKQEAKALEVCKPIRNDQQSSNVDRSTGVQNSIAFLTAGYSPAPSICMAGIILLTPAAETASAPQANRWEAHARA